jgi:putative acetyltransferase
VSPPVALRRYRPSDEDATIALWQRTWQAAYPDIDFAGRVAWWRERWRNELVPGTEIVVAEGDGGGIVGFVTVDPHTLYLDQIVVAPELWGSDAATALMAEAKRVSPGGLDLHVNQDHRRAVRFYEKQGFTIAAADVNPLSGRPTWRMRWRPSASD